MSENEVVIKIRADTERASQDLLKLNAKMKAALEIPTGQLESANTSISKWIDHLKAGGAENIRYSQRVAAITESYKAGALTADQARVQLERIRAEMEKADAPVKKATLSWKEFALGAAAVVAVSKQVYSAISAEITRWQNYALSALDASKTVGMTVDEFTRLIQISDDVRLSQEQLTQALQIAISKGFTPSIENLAKLADELRDMNATERATYLSDLFGKSWKNVYKILEDGGQALKDNTAAVADGLVVTGKAADEAEAYYQSVDRLNESLEQLKNKGLKGAIPILTFYTNTINNSEEYQRQFNEKLGIAADTFRVLFPLYAIGAQKINDTNKKAREFASSLALANAQIVNMGTYGPGAINEVGTAVDNTKRASDSWGARYQAEADKIKAANAEMVAQLNTELVGAFKNAQDASANWAKGAGGDIVTQLDDAGLSAGQLSQAFMAVDDSLGTNEFWTRKQKDATQKLVDEYKRTGDIDAFKEGLLRLKNGGFQELDHAVVVARDHIREVFADLEKYNGKSFTVYFNVEQSGGPAPSDSMSPGDTSYVPDNVYIPHRAGGGSVRGGNAYVVGEQGPELFVPGRSGAIVPNNQLNMGGITFNFYGVNKPGAIADAVQLKLASYGKQYQGA